MTIKMPIKITHPATIHTHVTSPTFDINWQYTYTSFKELTLLLLLPFLNIYDSMRKQVKARTG
jgi:hypothetical protein